MECLDHICYVTANLPAQLKLGRANRTLIIMEPIVSVLLSNPVAFVLRENWPLSESLELQIGA